MNKLLSGFCVIIISFSFIVVYSNGIEKCQESIIRKNRKASQRINGTLSVDGEKKKKSRHKIDRSLMKK